MKLRFALFLSLFAGVGPLAPHVTVHAQPASVTNYVLELDGTNSYVELPPNIFNHLTNATVEGWVKWKSLRRLSRFFDFGRENQSMLLSYSPDTFLRYDHHRSMTDIDFIAVPQVLRTGEWVHLAAVSGSRGMKLYLNGLLVGENPYTGSFSIIGNNDHNYLGHSGWNENADLEGQIAEVRVWATSRTEAQIRENMYRDLTGKEEGLAGLWNFEKVTNGLVTDLSPGHHDGRLMGNARVVSAQLPAPEQLRKPAILFVTVRDATGKPLPIAFFRVWHDHKLVWWMYCDRHGNGSVPLLDEFKAVDIEAWAGDLGAWMMDVRCLPPGQRTEANFALGKASVLSVKVSAFDRLPMPNLIVQAVRAEALPREPGRWVTPGLEGAQVTDAAGTCRFFNLPPGKYKLRLHLADAALDYPDGEAVEAKPGETNEIAIVAAPVHKGRWRGYTVANGLPSNRVLGLRFAPDGMLWVATEGGVARFDGREWIRFTKADGLMDDQVFCVQPGGRGELWFGTETGVSRLDPATGKFHTFPSGTNGLTAGRVFDMEAGPDGLLWLRTREGLTRYDGQQFQAVPGVPRLDQDPGNSNSKTKALAVDQAGDVWTVTENKGLWRVHGTNVVRVAEIPDGTLQDALHVAPDGQLWFQNNAPRLSGRITRYDGQRFVDLSPQESGLSAIATAIYAQPDGILWLGDSDGKITRFDPTRYTFTRLNCGAVDLGAEVLKIARGPDGALWCATTRGLWRYDEHSFVLYTRADGLPKNKISCSAVAADRTLWLTGNPGKAEEAFTARMNPTKARPGASLFESFGPERGLDKPGAYALEPDAEGGLWLGGEQNFRGLYYFDPKAESPSEKPFQIFEEFRGDYILGLHIDQKRTLWVGGGPHHLRRFSLDDLRQGKPKVEQIECVHVVGAIYEDAKGALWTANWKDDDQPAGLTRIQGTNLVHFSVKTTENGLPSDTVNGFGEGPDGYLYAGTDRGLARYDGSHFSTVERTPDRPVPVSQIRNILRDREGGLWFATDVGVTHYDGVAWSRWMSRTDCPRREFRLLLRTRRGRCGLARMRDWCVTRPGGKNPGRRSWRCRRTGIIAAAAKCRPSPRAAWRFSATMPLNSRPSLTNGSTGTRSCPAVWRPCPARARGTGVSRRSRHSLIGKPVRRATTPFSCSLLTGI